MCFDWKDLHVLGKDVSKETAKDKEHLERPEVIQ